MRFPHLAARSLSGVEYRLPEQLPARRTAVIAAFQQRHQRDVDQWIDALVAEGIPASIRGLGVEAPSAVIEVPMLRRRWMPARQFIDGGMASGIGDPDINARTWTCYTDVDAFLRAMQQPEESDTVLASVVQRDGEVLAWARDAPVPASLATIAAALAD